MGSVYKISSHKADVNYIIYFICLIGFVYSSFPALKKRDIYLL